MRNYYLTLVHKWVAFVALVLVILYPTKSFVGVGGTHWFIGIPFDTMMIKYGGPFGSTFKDVSVDFSWVGCAIDIFIWFAANTLFVWYTKRRKGRTKLSESGQQV